MEILEPGASAPTPAGASGEPGPGWPRVASIARGRTRLAYLFLAAFGCVSGVALFAVVGPGTVGVLSSLWPGLAALSGHTHVVLAIIVLAAYLAGEAARRLGQPRVVGEILVGIAVGPSLLGWIAPLGVETAAMPADTRGFLFDLGQLGITMYLLLAGLRLDLGSLRRKAGVAAIISSGALAAPLLFGALVGGLLFPTYGPATASPVLFSLFLGAAMAVSALPVLVRILDEHGLLGTPFGTLAVACATMDDLLAWLIFGAIMAQAGARASNQASLGLAGLAVLCGMLALSWPLWRRVGAGWLASEGAPGRAMPVLLAWGLLVAGMNEAFGLNGGVGAFYAGAVLPISRPFLAQVARSTEPVVVALLVPAFFVYAGALTRLQAVDRPEMWLLGVGLVAVAVLGKGVVAYALGRVGGLDHRCAGGIASLLNARGVMGLIILTSGLEVGLISTDLFTLMVLTVLVTNVLVNPALAWFRPSPDLGQRVGSR